MRAGNQNNKLENAKKINKSLMFDVSVELPSHPGRGVSQSLLYIRAKYWF